jgi:hypothetical protein
MSIISAVSHLAHEWRAARDLARTESAIRSLPLELQKDIGWPDAQYDRNTRRFLRSQ